MGMAPPSGGPDSVRCQSSILAQGTCREGWSIGSAILADRLAPGWSPVAYSENLPGAPGHLKVGTTWTAKVEETMGMPWSIEPFNDYSLFLIFMDVYHIKSYIYNIIYINIRLYVLGNSPPNNKKGFDECFVLRRSHRSISWSELVTSSYRLQHRHKLKSEVENVWTCCIQRLTCI